MTVKKTKTVAKAAKPVPVLVRIPPVLLKRLDAAAVSEERSRTFVVVSLLKERFGVKREAA